MADRELEEAVKRLLGLVEEAMTKPRTPEEIAEEWFKIHDGMCVRSIDGQPYREHFLAALREAADAARREDREALTAEIDRLSDQPLTDEQRMDALCRWNLARSRAEEPK